MARTNLAVIVPVFQGADVLHRLTDSLLAQQHFPAPGLHVEVILAVNDGSAESRLAAEVQAGRLQQAGYIASVLITARGRRQAIQHAEAALANPDCHRLYVDQDARLSPGVLSGLLAAFSDPCVGFAAPRAEFERSSSRWVRAYCRYWKAVPYCSASPVTMGAYAVSAEGRKRWGTLPDVASDDKFVRLQFAPAERRLIAAETYHVLPPQSLRELIRNRRRYLRGNRQLQKLPDPVPRYHGVLQPLRHPPRWMDFAVFASVFAAATLLEGLPKKDAQH